MFIAATHPQNHGEDPITTQAMTIPEQIKATKNTYSRKMSPPPDKVLFCGTLSRDATGLSDVNM